MILRKEERRNRVNIFSVTIFFSCLIHDAISSANQEHKIHDLILYPGKHSWCEAASIVQVVSHGNCSPVKVDNKICVGGCFSYVVPRTVPVTPGDVPPYCESCQPVSTTWKKVQLDCPNEGTNMTKYVEVISECSCKTCRDRSNDLIDLDKIDSTSSEDVNEESNVIEDSSINAPDILKFLKPANHTFQSPNIRALNMFVSSLMKRLESGDESFINSTRKMDRTILQTLLKNLETSDHSIDTGQHKVLLKKMEDEARPKSYMKSLYDALSKLRKQDSADNAERKANFETNGPHHSTVFKKDSIVVSDSGLLLKTPLEINTESVEKDDDTQTVADLIRAQAPPPPPKAMNRPCDNTSNTCYSLGMQSQMTNE